MTLDIPFSKKPGRHERHLIRRLNNPLFNDAIIELDNDTLLDVQKSDHEELVAHVDGLRTLVGKAVSLKPNEGSDVILKLKEELDMSYDQSCCLADEQGSNQQAIKQLIEIIMGTIRKAAGNDSVALQELADEDIAREEHHKMLQSPLVADLLDPNTLIAKNELSAALLSANESNLNDALKLFDQDQLSAIAKNASDLITNTEGLSEEQIAMVKGNLEIMMGAITS